jgi:hypothetical protein
MDSASIIIIKLLIASAIIVPNAFGMQAHQIIRGQEVKYNKKPSGTYVIGASARKWVDLNPLRSGGADKSTAIESSSEELLKDHFEEGDEADTGFHLPLAPVFRVFKKESDKRNQWFVLEHDGSFEWIAAHAGRMPKRVNYFYKI